MSITKEFKKFAMRGNVIDMAVGIVIGSAFGKIVSSMVSDIFLPPIGFLLGGVKFTDLKYIIKEEIPAKLDATGKVITQIIPAVSINYGNFIQVTLDYIIIAFAIFMIIKAVNSAKKKEKAAPVPPPEPSKEEILLTEIRDLLKTK